MRVFSYFPSLLTLALSLSPAFAQAADNWQRFDPPSTTQSDNRQIADGQAPTPPQGAYPRFPSGNDPAPEQMPPPASLTIPAGKYLTVRTNNFITSDKNHPGDFFSATLLEPLVVDGFVVAARGQTINGRVVDVEKAGRVKGVSSLRLELTELLLVDGQQIPFRSQMVYRQGDTSVGRDVAGVGTTTALGAAVGAGAAGGFGAGMGAIGGALVGTIGILTTRGRPTVVYPETPLTFRVDQPLTISTARSPGAFTQVAREDYQKPAPRRPRLGPRPAYYGDRVPAAYPYYYGPGAYWGPSVYFGTRFHYGRGFRRW